MSFRGMYVCRTLSYKGADFDTVEAPLEERMMVKTIKYQHVFSFSYSFIFGGMSLCTFMSSSCQFLLIHKVILFVVCIPICCLFVFEKMFICNNIHVLQLIDF